MLEGPQGPRMTEENREEEEPHRDAMLVRVCMRAVLF